MNFFILACLTLLLSTEIVAQNIDWDEIDIAISSKKNLGDLNQRLEVIKQTANKNNEVAKLARCYWYQVKIADLKTEDTCWFKNSASIDSLVQATNSPYLKSIMLLLKARRIAGFSNQFYNNNNKSLFIIPANTIDYSKLTMAELDSLVSKCMNQAKDISLTLNQKGVTDLLWLSTDPLLFLFKPDYTDIIFGEQLHATDKTIRNKANDGNAWLKLSSEAFISTKNLPAGIDSFYEPMYRIYSDWAAYAHKSPAAYYFIESLARKYFYSHSKETDSTYLLYESYLQRLAVSGYGTVRAHAVYQLALRWKALGDSYNKKFRRYYYIENNTGYFDSSKRWYYVKAVNLVESNSNLLDSFFYLKKKLLLLKATMLDKSLHIKSDDTYLPGVPFKLRLDFKNIQTLHFKIVRLGSLDIENKKPNISVANLRRALAFKTLSVALPAAKDFQLHSCFIQMDGMPPGRYAVIFSDSAIAETKGSVDYFMVSITNIAAINNDSRVFILDRVTGQPLVNAQVLVTYKPVYGKPETRIAYKKVNAQGYVFIREENIESVVALNGTDTTFIEVRKIQSEIPENVFDKEEDELADYYEDNLYLHLFTDRAIYRPGQTLFFKGILLTRNPSTGKLVVFNKTNLQLPFIKRLFDKEIKRFIKTKRSIYINDALGKTVDSVKILVNEYGSFTGEYKVGEKAATGDWEFDTDDEDIEIDNRNDGHFKVEEYKRPTFELQIEKPANFLELGDSFFVKIKVRSFTGVQLNNVKITYKLTAELNGVLKNSDSKIENWNSEKLADTTGYTNNNGELFVKVSSTFLNGYNFNNKTRSEIKYHVEAEATDATGETHEASLDVSVNNRPVKIDFSLAPVYENKRLGQVAVTTKNMFSGMVTKKLEAAIYKLNRRGNQQSRNAPDEDYVLINGAWMYKIPNVEKPATADTVLVYQTSLISNTDKLNLPADLLQAGEYRMEITCTENGEIKGQNSRNFSVFDGEKKTWADTTKDFYYLPENAVVKGQSVRWLFGTTSKNIYSVYHVQYYAHTKKGIKEKYLYNFQNNESGMIEWKFKIPDDVAESEMILTHLYIRNNQLKRQSATLYLVKKTTKEPEIVVEKYRSKLTPGSKETFVVRIKTTNEAVAAELMTTMYDASLDKIEEQHWDKPSLQRQNYLQQQWPNEIVIINECDLADKNPVTYNFLTGREDTKPLWWLNPLDYAYGDINKISSDFGGNNYMTNQLSGRVPGVSVSSNLNEVVVMGYGMAKKNLAISSSTIRVRGLSSFSGNNAPLVLVDGVVYMGELAKFNADLITDAVVLNGADATALYGARAANGIVVISTKGMVELPKAEDPPVIVRKNFAETAFFIPQVHADAAGYYNISFTIPESVTEWKWKMLAHTKDARFMFAERIINTQLPLIVQPSIPRFLFQGDEINLQTRVSNLDTTDLAGVSNCEIEDAVTGENISALIAAKSIQSFSVERKSNNTISYRLKVPDSFLHPLKIKISARAGNFSDGEEYTIPVLSKKILVAQSMPFTFGNATDTVIGVPALPADAASFGIGLYSTPQPQAAMINALPYLAFYKYTCAEQTFNKILAYSLAVKLIQHDSLAQQTLQQQKAVPVKDNNNVTPDELSEETMPWLELSNQTTKNQQQLAKLFDSLQSKAMIKKYLADLTALQNKDGGVSWFKGGESSPYISNYLLAGFGKLNKDSIRFTFNQTDADNFKMLPALIAYCDNIFITTPLVKQDALFYLYARSWWTAQFAMPAEVKAKADTILTEATKKIDSYNLGKQALLIITAMHYPGANNQFYTRAMEQLESIRQLAIGDAMYGVRWKDISNTDDFNNTGEETIALLASAFDKSGQSKKTVNGVIKWLLNAKEQHNWRTTKATAAVVGLLYKQQPGITGIPASITAKAGDSRISVTNDLLKGQPFSFKQMQYFPATVNIKSRNAALASGGLTYYYFTATPPQNELYNGLKISKQLFKLDNKNNWQLVNDTSVLTIAGRIKTVITIQAPKQLKYVFIDEKHSAASEPVDGMSSYVYAKDFSYYRSVRDAGYQFFAEQIPSGISTIEYETINAKEGHFSTGTVSLQCMYQPAIRAYGEGKVITVRK
ncbi:alpha-2-macroglobulin family protein [soil metagenome]